MSKMFDEVKVGDKLYAIGLGEAIVINVDKDSFNVIGESNMFRTYYKDGKYHIFDIEPSIFWEKPFDLEKELKKLEIKEFKGGQMNHYLAWNNKDDEIVKNYMIYYQDPFLICFTEESINNFMKNIKDKEITKEQFFTAYKNVFGGIINE